MAVSWARARELAHAAPTQLAPVTRPLSESSGLTLAAGIHTRLPLPAFDTAAMDGYAVAGAGPWRVRGVVRAGAVWTGPRLSAGEAVEISTGAEVPAGADAILPTEKARRHAGAVHGGVPPAGRHIRRAGEDAPVGACLAPRPPASVRRCSDWPPPAATTPSPCSPGPGSGC